MSSVTESVKHASEGDAPDAKKVKIDEREAASKSSENSAENNNGTAGTDCNNQKKDTEGGDLKSSNGNDKEPQNVEGIEQDGDGASADDLDSEEEPMDPNTARSLQHVQGIQQRISKLNELASEEILTVEQKFNKLRRPHFEERNELLKDIPNFWVTCLANHPTTTQLIESAEDEDCLHYMVNLDVEELDDIKSGYNLKFHFKENPYIKNEVIVKELRHLNSDEVVSKSTSVEYKETPQARALKTLVENSLRQMSGAVADRSDQFSFFAWMCLPSETSSDEIAEIIKDQIWPSPLEFYFNAQGDDYDGTDDDDEDDSDEEDYDEEDFDGDAHGEMPEEDIEGEELDDEDDEGEDGEHDEVDEEDEE